ncbi:hypothetical protein Vafri_11685, partial [Volvox africanus]
MATVSAISVMLPAAWRRRVPPHGGAPGLSTLRNPFSGSITIPITTVDLARTGPVVTRSSSDTWAALTPDKRTSALVPTALYDNNDGVESLEITSSPQATSVTPAATAAAAAAAAAAVSTTGDHRTSSVSSASGNFKDLNFGIDGPPDIYRATGLYSMTNDELLELLFQRAGLQALQFAPALPHMAASTRYMQYPPGVPPSSSSIPTLDSPHDAASSPLVAGSDRGVKYGGPEYSECCRRFVGHLRDTLLMDEREVFGLLSRLPSLAVVPPARINDVIVYLSLVIKGAGRGHRFQYEGASPPLASLPPASVLMTYPRVPAAEGPCLEKIPASSHPDASGPAGARRSASLSEEEELDLALYHFLRHAPAVLAMSQNDLSRALEWLSAEGGLDYLDMCRLLCAVPQLLPGVAARLAEAAARDVRRPAPIWGSAADASTAPRGTTLQHSRSGSEGFRSESPDHLKDPCDGPPTLAPTQSAVQGEVGDIGDAGVKCERIGRGTFCTDGYIRDVTTEIRRLVDLARRQTALGGAAGGADKYGQGPLG